MVMVGCATLLPVVACLLAAWRDQAREVSEMKHKLLYDRVARNDALPNIHLTL